MTEIAEANEPTKTEPTEEQWEQAMEWLRAHPYGEQDENGIDISYLRENLRLTPTQRLEKHNRALEVFMEVRRAGETARLSKNS